MGAQGRDELAHGQPMLPETAWTGIMEGGSERRTPAVSRRSQADETQRHLLCGTQLLPWPLSLLRDLRSALEHLLTSADTCSLTIIPEGRAGCQDTGEKPLPRELAT